MRIKPAPIRVACGHCTHFVLIGNGITKRLILIHFLTHVLEAFCRMTGSYCGKGAEDSVQLKFTASGLRKHTKLS